MIGDDNVACLVVEAEVLVVLARSILGSLYHETEIDGEALVTLSGTTGVVEATCGLAHFRGHTRWALVGATGKRKLRDTDGVFVHVRHATTVEVT